MNKLRGALIGAACLVAWASASLVGCKRASDRGGTVAEDLKDIGKATEKTAKDIGHATAQGMENAKNTADVGTQDAWITTKVKSELTGAGFDPLHVHVDTNAKVVTLSGPIDSPAKAEKAVTLARSVSGVAEVRNRLFVNTSPR